MSVFLAGSKLERLDGKVIGKLMHVTFKPPDMIVASHSVLTWWFESPINKRWLCFSIKRNMLAYYPMTLQNKKLESVLDQISNSNYRSLASIQIETHLFDVDTQRKTYSTTF